MLTRFRQTGWAIALWAIVLLIFAVASVPEAIDQCVDTTCVLERGRGGGPRDRVRGRVPDRGHRAAAHAPGRSAALGARPDAGQRHRAHGQPRAAGGAATAGCGCGRQPPRRPAAVHPGPPHHGPAVRDRQRERPARAVRRCSAGSSCDRSVSRSCWSTRSCSGSCSSSRTCWGSPGCSRTRGSCGCSSTPSCSPRS